nr:MAG TPA: hypothetical protein [Caudoviricetes sp.]
MGETLGAETRLDVGELAKEKQYDNGLLCCLPLTKK